MEINRKDNLDDSEIDEEELQDKILSEDEKVENDLLDQNIDENDIDFNDLEDEEDIKKDFEDNILENLNNQNISNENILDLDIENIKKGIGISHKKEFLDLFFDCTFYTSRNLEVEKLVKLIKKESNHGLTGLKNLKNSAFMNTIIQCLSHTLDFTYYILSENYLEEINKLSKTKGSVVKSLFNIFSLMWNSNEKSISPTDFKYNLLTYLPNYSNNNFQFDASEFLFNLFEILNEELSLIKTKGNQVNIETAFISSKMNGESDIQASKRFWNAHKNWNNSIISDLFYGQYKSTINCLVCNNTEIYFEPFSTLTLEIPQLKRIDFILVSSFNTKPVIKLTCYIPSNSLFVDLPKFTTEKFRNENTSFFSEKTILKCLLVNCTTYSSRFVKLNDNIYQSSKKGNLIIFEVNQDNEESDYYPYICMIKDEKLVNQEKNNEENEEELKDEIKERKDNENNQEKKETKKKPENLVYAYKRKEVPNPEDTKNKTKQKPELENVSKNLSFPRLFNIPLGKNVRYLRVSLYAFLSKFYSFNFKDTESNSIPKIKRSKFDLDNIYENIESINKLNEDNYFEYHEEEYKYLFEDNYHLLSNTDYFKDFPFVVKLVSAKDENKFKIFFSKNPEEFISQFESEMTLQKLNQYIKQGYKLVIEVNKENKHYESLKKKLNEIISISPLESYEGKVTNLYDCLDNFILSEKLEKGNEWYCECCKKNQNSMKKMELYYLPKNLIIILKRFETKMIGKTKIQIWKNNDLVKYPVNNLKLDNYFFSNTYYKENNTSFDLYAISQHSGSLEGGHYATACRNFGKWYELDDSTVFQSDEDTIISKEAYILFYRRKDNFK